MLDQITLDAIEHLRVATEDIVHEVALALASHQHKARGVVLPLTQQERVNRMLWLAGELTLDKLDHAIDGSIETVRGINGYEVTPELAKGIRCATGYYLLKQHNGGKDPTAIDPFDRWSNEGSTFINRTADCIAGAAWCGGWDRFQATRFAHIYDGWINTDSMIMDALGPKRCFVPLDEPEDGCYVVCATGSPGHEKCGHIGGIPKGKRGFDRKSRQAWADLGVIDIAARGAGVRANRRTTAAGWYGSGALFVKSVMVAA